MRILVIEDAEDLADAVVDSLRSLGHAVDWAADGHQAEELLRTETYQLIILDVMLPGPDGQALLGQLRRRGNRTPVLVTTARSQIDTKIHMLDLGADDYIVKPFNNREFVARVKAVLRRTARESVPIPAPCKRGYRFAGFTLDEDGRRLFDPAGKPVSLTVAEFDLLVALVRAHGRVLSRNQILDLTHHDRDDVFDRTIDVLILRLRRKIERNPQQPWLIRTERGLGYVFDCDIEVFGH